MSVRTRDGYDRCNVIDEERAVIVKGKLDRRLHAFRPDLADAALKANVKARRFTTGRRCRVITPVLDLRSEPGEEEEFVTQALMGETLTVFDNDGEWSWVQLDADSYVGYARTSGLADVKAEVTHIVTAPRTFIYSAADLRSPPRLACSMGSRLVLGDSQVTRGTAYLLVEDGGAIIARHVVPISDRSADYVNVAAAFLRTPYLWGGRSAFGIDCSALVQLSMAMCGLNAPRDCDMQAVELGSLVDSGADFSALKRGDLVFWKRHVAIAENVDTLIHASDHTMQVVREPVRDAIARIEPLYGKPVRVRRP